MNIGEKLYQHFKDIHDTQNGIDGTWVRMDGDAITDIVTYNWYFYSNLSEAQYDRLASFFGGVPYPFSNLDFSEEENSHWIGMM